MGKGGLACAAPFPKSCAQIGAQDSGCFFYNRSDQQNFKITKFIVDYCSVARTAGLKYGSPSAHTYTSSNWRRARQVAGMNFRFLEVPTLCYHSCQPPPWVSLSLSFFLSSSSSSRAVPMAVSLSLPKIRSKSPRSRAS